MEFSTEEKASGLISDLRDLRGISLSEVAASVKAGDASLSEPLRRVAPRDGTNLPVAAFNSAI
jgi:FXSXX-COOH protein